MSDNPTTAGCTGPADEVRLYGLPGAERLYLDPATVYESQIEPWWDDLTPTEKQRPREIEEWSVTDPIEHLPRADHIVEYLVEMAGDELTEEGFLAWEKAGAHEDVHAAAEALRTALASKVKFHMANEHLRSLWITWDESGQPLLDGAPLYESRRDPPKPARTPWGWDTDLRTWVPIEEVKGA